MILIIHKNITLDEMLLRDKDRYLIVRQSDKAIEPVEVLVYDSDERGNITGENEVAGDIGICLDGYINKAMKNGINYKPWETTNGGEDCY